MRPTNLKSLFVTMLLVFFLLPSAAAAAAFQPAVPQAARTAWPAGLAVLQATVQPTAALAATSLPVFAVQTATPMANGSIIHEVMPGQTLFSIAEAYGIPITTLAALNNLATPYTIFPGDKLVIRAQPTITPTGPATATLQATRTATPTQRPPTGTPSITPTPAPTLTPTAEPWLRMPEINLDSRSLGIIIIAVCVIGLVVVGLTAFRKP